MFSRCVLIAIGLSLIGGCPGQGPGDPNQVPSGLFAPPVLKPDPFSIDSDGDGLSDGKENEIGSDPQKADTDGDGLNDAEELNLGTDPLLPDTDNDGLPDVQERSLGTSPTQADTDQDGITDGAESELGTDPTKADTDGDGISDGDELDIGTDPLAADTDKDGLSDSDELDRQTDPLVEDTDDDGLLDEKEVDIGTDPLKEDSDEDGLLDGAELDMGTDPLLDDTDGDGLFDGTEVLVGLDPLVANEVGLVSKVYSDHAAELFSNDSSLWYTDSGAFNFDLWEAGDLIVFDRDANNPAVATITNVTLGAIGVAIDYGPIVDSGVITDAAVDLSWIEVDFGIHWFVNPFDINSIPLWSFGDFVLVASDAENGLTRMVNITFGDDALLIR